MGESCQVVVPGSLFTQVPVTGTTAAYGLAGHAVFINGRYDQRSQSSNYAANVSNTDIPLFNDASMGRRVVRPLFIHRLPTTSAGVYDPTGQPLLIPILNIQNPTGDANRWGGTTTSTTFANSPLYPQDKGFSGNLALGDLLDGSYAVDTVFRNDEVWVQVAAPSLYNVVVVAGASPSTAGTTALGTSNYYDSKFGGGLHNFPRFLELWEGSAALINGSLIQSKPSTFATGSWQASDRSQRASAFYDVSGSTAEYMDSFATSAYNFIYRGGASGALSPYYLPPKRYWGYDVGILSQSPDLFAQRFTVASTVRPPEFYRETSRNDTWVQSLLCAAQRTNPTSGATYVYAVDSSLRQSCRSTSDYVD